MLKSLGLGALALLLMLLTGVLVLVPFLAFENWRGHRAWEKFTAECEAAGESLRPEAVIPPPVPDEENFATIPLFAPLFEYKIAYNSIGWVRLFWADKEEVERLVSVGSFIRGYEHPEIDPPRQTVEWSHGRLFDATAWQAYFRSKTNIIWPSDNRSAAEDVLFALSRFDHDIAQLYATADRPACRLDFGNESYPGQVIGAGRFFDVVFDFAYSVLGFAEIITLRSAAKLSTGDSRGAADDVLLSIKLMNQFRSTEPLVFSGAFPIQHAASAVWDGLVRGAWSDEQLRSMDSELMQIDRLADCKTTRRHWSLVTVDRIERFGEARPLDLVVGLTDRMELSRLYDSVPYFGLPLGIRRLYEIPAVRPNYQFISLIDTQQRVFRVSEIKGLSSTLPLYANHRGVAKGLTIRIDNDLPLTFSRYVELLLYGFGFDAEISPLFYEDIRMTLGYQNLVAEFLTSDSEDSMAYYAHTQSTVDLCRVAIALERHRLRHGQFPESLDALDPDVRPVGGIPHDVINGEALRYRRTEDGRFQLYSVGWNQTDDGGTTVWSGGWRGSPDREQGDWVWPQPVPSP